MVPALRPSIFVHIQKTGGTAVRSALGMEIYAERKHFLARDLRDVYGKAAWESSFKFSFVRNPWDRLVSWWSMIDNHRHASTAANSGNEFTRYVRQRAQSFEEFLTRCTDEIVETDGRKHIFRDQIDYLVDDKGKLIVDFVGRFERLQEDFDQVTARLGVPSATLPRVNSSQHAAYTSYYTPAMAEEVGRRYARDILAFSYRFGD